MEAKADKDINRTYLYDTHIHTSEVSPCSHNTASEIVEALHKAGYQGAIITDHFFNGNCLVDQRQPWSKMVEDFFAGYEEAVKAVHDLGIDFDVYFGFEYGYHATEFLILGLDKEFLLNNEDLLDWPIETFFDKTHEAGGFVIHAHPFRIRPYITEIRLFTEYIDAVEVKNQGNDLDIFNDQALEYALEHNKYMTMGTDLHDIKHIRGTGMKFNRRPKDVNDFIECIKEYKRAFK